mmetsp:Transcript_69501/g.187882  ORF Transcript_69501/g.187882 Transcript_69501/m.187882 type:complete len:446 (+) Transcript_69501:322-1659(+)
MPAGKPRLLLRPRGAVWERRRAGQLADGQGAAGESAGVLEVASGASRSAVSARASRTRAGGVLRGLRGVPAVPGAAARPPRLRVRAGAGVRAAAEARGGRFRPRGPAAAAWRPARGPQAPDLRLPRQRQGQGGRAVRRRHRGQERRRFRGAGHESRGPRPAPRLEARGRGAQGWYRGLREGGDPGRHLLHARDVEQPGHPEGPRRRPAGRQGGLHPRPAARRAEARRAQGQRRGEEGPANRAADDALQPRLGVGEFGGPAQLRPGNAGLHGPRRGAQLVLGRAPAARRAVAAHGGGRPRGAEVPGSDEAEPGACGPDAGGGVQTPRRLHQGAAERRECRPARGHEAVPLRTRLLGQPVLRGCDCVEDEVEGQGPVLVQGPSQFHPGAGARERLSLRRQRDRHGLRATGQVGLREADVPVCDAAPSHGERPVGLYQPGPHVFTKGR